MPNHNLRTIACFALVSGALPFAAVGCGSSGGGDSSSPTTPGNSVGHGATSPAGGTAGSAIRSAAASPASGGAGEPVGGAASPSAGGPGGTTGLGGTGSTGGSGGIAIQGGAAGLSGAAGSAAGACEIASDVTAVSIAAPSAGDPLYVDHSKSSFSLRLTISAKKAIAPGSTLLFDLPQVTGKTFSHENATPTVAGLGVSKSTEGNGTYQLPLNEGLAAGQSFVLELSVDGSGSPGLHSPRSFRLTRGAGVVACRPKPHFDRLAFLGSHNDSLTPNISDLPDILRSNAANPDGYVAKYGTEHHKPVSDYSYLMAFAVRREARMNDCNVPWTTQLPQTACQRGAAWARENYEGIYLDHLAFGKKIQGIIDSNRLKDPLFPNSVFIQLEADNHQYRLWQDSFAPAYVNPAGEYAAAATAGFALDKSCNSGIVNRQGQAPIALGKNLNADDFLNTFSRRLDHPTEATPYYTYRFDEAAQKCVYDDATKARVAADATVNPWTGERELLNEGLSPDQHATLLAHMAKAIKTHCHSCVINYSAPDFMGDTVSVLSKIDRDPIAGPAFEYIFRYFYATPGSSDLAPISRGFADMTAQTGRPSILERGVVVPRGWTLTTVPAANTWLSRNALQAAWNSGIRALQVSAQGEPCPTADNPNKKCTTNEDAVALQNFVRENTVTHPIRDLETPPSSTTPENWYPDWKVSMGAALYQSFCLSIYTDVMAPPGFRVVTADVAFPADSGQAALHLLTAAEAAGATKSTDQYFTSWTETPSNGRYSSKGFADCQPMTVELTLTDDGGHVARWKHDMAAAGDLGTFLQR